MATIDLSLTGPFPRSEALVAATRDLDRGRRKAEEVTDLYRAATSEVLALERKIGASSVTGGLLANQDLFRPFVETLQGVSIGPLTRWFETNSFYRQPIVEAVPQRRPGAWAKTLWLDLLHSAKLPPKVILPGPYTASGLVDNRTDMDRLDFAKVWSRLLADEIRELAGLGVKVVQFQEPLLVNSPPSMDEESWVLEAYAPLAPALTGLTSLVWTFYGDGAPVLSLLGKLPVHIVGIDLADTDPADLREFARGKGLGLGCLDSRTSLPEDPREIARLVRELEGRLSPASIHLGAGAPLDLVPVGPAQKKLHVLPEAVAILEHAKNPPSKHGASA